MCYFTYMTLFIVIPMSWNIWAIVLLTLLRRVLETAVLDCYVWRPKHRIPSLVSRLLKWTLIYRSTAWVSTAGQSAGSAGRTAGCWRCHTRSTARLSAKSPAIWQRRKRKGIVVIIVIFRQLTSLLTKEKKKWIFWYYCNCWYNCRSTI